MGEEQIKKRLIRTSYNFSHRSAKFHELNRFCSILSETPEGVSSSGKELQVEATANPALQK